MALPFAAPMMAMPMAMPMPQPQSPQVPIRRPTMEFKAVAQPLPMPMPAAAEVKEVVDLVPEKHSVWNSLRNGPLKIAIMGSGNWGTVIARVIGKNVSKSYLFNKTVSMYVYEEMWEGRKLTEIINTEHENKKYLPGVKLPNNVVAYPDARAAAKDANILIFVLPHQFVPQLCESLSGHVAKYCKGISLIKGIICRDGKAKLISSEISRILGIDVCVLSGANVAMDIGLEQFSETTIGYNDLETASLMQQLFDTPYFRVNLVRDVPGVEVCGALKNIVALSAGFVDGLGLGSNTKAAIIRLGLVEMRKFAHTFFEGVLEETFFDSCGLADVITTCYGGRNRQCAEQFVKTGKPWRALEKELLSGQKLQGTGTCAEVYDVLKANNLLDEFPLFHTTFRIAFQSANPTEIVTAFMSDTPRPPEQYGSPKMLLQMAAHAPHHGPFPGAAFPPQRPMLPAPSFPLHSRM